MGATSRSEYTPEKVAELVEQVRRVGAESTQGTHTSNSPILRGADLANRTADALTAVSAERDAAIRDLDAGFTESDHLSAKYYQRMRRAEDDLTRARRMGRAENSDNLRLVEINTELLAERDRLHKAITEALDHDPLHGRSEGLHCGGMSPCIHGIFRAALDKEGNDDAKR